MTVVNYFRAATVRCLIFSGIIGSEIYDLLRLSFTATVIKTPNNVAAI